MSKCDDIRGRLTLYLDDELQGTERATVEAHLSECEACAAIFARELNFLNTVRESGQLYTAPPELRAKVQQILRPRRRSRFGGVVAGGAVLVGVGLAGGGWGVG